MKKGIFVVSLILSTLSATAAELDVFVLTGQSNSLGIITDGEPLALEENKIDKKVSFFWVNRDPRGRVISTSDGKIDKLQIQMETKNERAGNWGLEVNCARNLYKKGMKKLLFIKVSRGGGGNKFWSKGSADDHMYQAIVETVGDAVKELKKKKVKFNIRGLLYLQGESDGVDSKLAGERAAQLLTNLRKDLPRAKRMKMFIGGIAGGGASQELVRTLHSDLAKKNKDFYFVPTDDLLKTNLYRDRLHFNNEAKMEIGKRFAEVIYKALK